MAWAGWSASNVAKTIVVYPPQTPVCGGDREIALNDIARVNQPAEGDERSVLLGWLAFYRNALEAKCHGLTPEQLTERALPPSTLSLLGLVRHLTEMERAYGVWALGPDIPLTWVWGEYTDDGPAWDFDAEPSMAIVSFEAWEQERRSADALISAYATLDDKGNGNGYSVRWNLLKLIGEYARHCGHADLLRERLDGQTGE